MKTKLYSSYQKINQGVLAFEKSAIVISLFFMTCLVFLDVVQRTSGRIVSAFLAASNLGLKVSTLWPFILGGAVVWALLYFAIYTYRKPKTDSLLVNFLGSLVLGVALGIVVYLVVRLFPTGVSGAQKFSLGFMMWAAFLGASVASNQKRHLILGALKSKVDDSIAPFFAFLAGLLSATFCGYLAYLAYLQLRFEIIDWQSASGVGLFEALPIPLWVVTVAIPLSMLIMAVRFFFFGLFVALGLEKPQQQEPHLPLVEEN